MASHMRVFVHSKNCCCDDDDDDITLWFLFLRVQSTQCSTYFNGVNVGAVVDDITDLVNYAIDTASSLFLILCLTLTSIILFLLAS